MHALLSLVQLTDPSHLYTAALPLTKLLSRPHRKAQDTHLGKHFGGSATLSHLSNQTIIPTFYKIPRTNGVPRQTV
jgi:hypothetical protein